MRDATIARLAVLGILASVAPGALRALPDPAPANPASTGHSKAKIESAERKRQMRQAKRLAQKGGAK